MIYSLGLRGVSHCEKRKKIAETKAKRKIGDKYSGKRGRQAPLGADEAEKAGPGGTGPPIHQGSRSANTVEYGVVST